MAILALGGCAVGQPAPQSSDFFKTVGGGALIERRGDAGSMYMSLLLEWNRIPPPNALVVAEFESKTSKGPFLVEWPVADLEAKPILKSPTYPCVVNRTRYDVTVKLYADASKQTLLGVHDQKLAFSVPQSLLHDLKLKECAGL